MSSWLFTLFDPSPADKLRECRRTVSTEHRRLKQLQQRERQNMFQARLMKERAVANNELGQAHQYATQELASEAAEIQLLNMQNKLVEFQRALERSETVVQMEQVMISMSQALAQLNASISPQHMQHQVMHLEMNHSQLELKHEMLLEATESMRESDNQSVDTTQVEILKSISASSNQSGSGGNSAQTITIPSDISEEDARELRELQALVFKAEAESGGSSSSSAISEASLDPAARLVLETQRAQKLRKEQSKLPTVPKKPMPTSTTITGSVRTSPPFS